MKNLFSLVIACFSVSLLSAGALAAEEVPLTGNTTSAPRFTSVPTVLLRTPDPSALAEFYVALGMRIDRVSENGVFIYLEDNTGSLEILKMHPDTKPGEPKTSRTQQGVLVIFETSDLDEVLRRAKAAGSPAIDTWTHPRAGVSIHYIADPEYNFIGFAPRHHNPNLQTP